MPLSKIAIKPGVNTVLTQVAAAGTWFSGNLIRWRNGMLERILGWVRLTSQQASGLIRALWAWEDLSGNLNLALGTDGGVQVYVNGTINTLLFASTTPIATAASNFHASAGSTLITVVSTDTTGNIFAGSTITIASTMSLGGRLIQSGSSFTVLGLIGSTSFTFNMPLVATSGAAGALPQYTTPNSGLSLFTFITVTLINHGLSNGQPFTVAADTTVDGMTLKSGTYLVSSATTNTFQMLVGHKRTTAASAFENNNIQSISALSTVAPPTQEVWYLDNFGQILVVVYTQSNLYSWTPPLPTTGNGLLTVVPNSPQINNGMLVAMPQAQIVLFGVSVADSNAQDPLLLAWCHAGDFTIWVADATNQAGTFRLSRGSIIVGAIQAPQSLLIWTDIDLWSMQYMGPPFVYSFTILGTACGLIAPKARAILGRNTYWMGTQSFWEFADGGAQPLQCDVRDNIFNDIDAANAFKIWAWAISSTREVWFFYPSASGGTGEIDSYVKYNTDFKLWDYGRLVRTAGIGENIFGFPLAGDGNMRIQQHENGLNDDTGAITGAFAETGMFEIGDGTQMLLLDQFIPDFKWFSATSAALGSMTITIKSWKYPSDNPQVYGPYSFTPTMRFMPLRVRGRFIALRFDWAATMNFNARLGAPMGRFQPSGTWP